VTTRLICTSDAADLAALLIANRDHLAPYEPDRPAEYFTADGQHKVIEDVLRQHDEGNALPLVIVDDGRLRGRITLSTIVRGPFQSASLGYWVDAGSGGRGLGTAAVQDIVRVAFGDLGLHRIDAGTLVDNLRSQRVLRKNGFQPYGLAPRYLKIAGDWRDHVLFQLLNEQVVAAYG
jgi:ribosomal-protein-alanine N-acetyltransferase